MRYDQGIRVAIAMVQEYFCPQVLKVLKSSSKRGMFNVWNYDKSAEYSVSHMNTQKLEVASINSLVLSGVLAS